MNATQIQIEKLLDTIKAKLGLKNDAALSRKLDVGHPVVSKLRHGRMAISDTLAFRMCDLLDMKPSELRALVA